MIDAERINIRERDGTLKAVLSNAAGFNEGQRGSQAGGVRFSGLMFYNEEGDADNKPHFEVYDAFGKKVVYELQIPRSM